LKEEIFDKELALHFYRKILKRVEFVRALVENDEKIVVEL